MTEAAPVGATDSIEVNPVVVLFQVFPARPSSIPEIRDFVRRCLAESPLTEEGNREVSETVFRALLDAAGPEGSIQVAFRIFPEHVEVDVLHSDNQVQPPNQSPRGVEGAAAGPQAAAAAPPRAEAVPVVKQRRLPGPERGPVPLVGDGSAPAGVDGWELPAADGSAPEAAADPADPADTFADWMSLALRREGLTQEAAARLLGVSVKTVSRWVGGATEPRLRDLRRIQEVFGEVPLQ